MEIPGGSMENRPKLLQEEYVETDNGPWKVWVVCIFLNQTTWKQAEPVAKRFFEKWPSPEEFCGRFRLEITDVYEVIAPLGLKSRRADLLYRMTEDFLHIRETRGCEYGDWPIRDRGDVRIRGVGKYAKDAWRLFVRKEKCDPEDVQLRRYAMEVGLCVT
jgi:adenine-specific DNA glycosylase